MASAGYAAADRRSRMPRQTGRGPSTVYFPAAFSSSSMSPAIDSGAEVGA